jgi:predicted DCC family thiol-disulfide oxidoreductase YuxK
MTAIGIGRSYLQGMNAPLRYTVIYDSDCGFCRWCLSLLLRADREHRLRPLALGTPEADRLLAGMPREEQFASWHLVDPDGRLTSAGAGLPDVLRALPAGQLPAGVLAQIPTLTERGYRWVADHRTTLGPLLPARVKARATERIAARARETG